MKQVFGKAFAMGYIRRDPTVDLELPAIDREQKMPLTVDQVRRLISVVDPHPSAIVFHLMFTLGLRIGEALAIKRTDFTTDFSELKINQAIDFHTNKAGAPKRKSRRLLAVPNRLQARCAAHWARVLEQQEDSAPDFANLGIFCPSESGTPIQPRNFERVWAGQTKHDRFYPGMKQKAKLPEGTVLHDLRAFVTTMLVDVDAQPIVISHVLGHGAKNVTEQYMRRHLPTMRRALDKLEMLFWEDGQAHEETGT